MATTSPLELKEVPVHYDRTLEDGQVRLHLSQEWRQQHKPPQPFLDTLKHIPSSAHLAVLSEHPDAYAYMEDLKAHAKAYKQLLVVPLGVQRFEEPACRNRVAVIWPEGHLFLDKLSLSSDDQEGQVVPGGTLHLFETPLGRLAVLNCHEYTHVDLIHQLAEWEVELLVVVTVNLASRLYWDYALADAHRLFCFIVIGNIADYGGTAVFAPFRKLNTPLRLGSRLLHTRGPAELRADVPLEVGQLRRHRAAYRQKGDGYTPKEVALVVPPERFLHESPARVPYRQGAAERVHTVRVPAAAASGPLTRIAVAQLRAPSLDAYLQTAYRFSRAPDYPVFREVVRQHLATLARTLSLRNQQLDFLVFPEVFLPRELFAEVQDFAVRHGTIVIAGAEYKPLEPERFRRQGLHGANDCVLFIPDGKGGCDVHSYRKLTRSQYDARRPGTQGALGEKFPLDAGDQLLRFQHSLHGDFGVLICYDFSHLDIVRSLNLSGGAAPCELLFVVSYNPDAELYRACSIADAHRYYQYVVMCNVADYGGSGIFGPVRTPGTRQVIAEAGKGMEGVLLAEVDLDGLRLARAAQDSRLHPSGRFQRRPGILHGRLLPQDARDGTSPAIPLR